MNDELKVGMEIPVYGQQLKGCYLDSRDGRRYSHFAVPGWYRIVAIEGESVRLERVAMDPFVTSKTEIMAVLFGNLEMASEIQP